MMLSHYSSSPFVFDPARDYTNDGHFKPRGLWLSVDGPDDWKEWCEAENFHVDGLNHRTPVKLADGANVLHINTVAALDAFERRYQVFSAGIDMIDWPRVARDYDGIIIAPYHATRRFSTWYYPWDCASACIWNLHAIAAVGEMETAQ